jgi:hypothetical protein
MSPEATSTISRRGLLAAGLTATAATAAGCAASEPGDVAGSLQAVEDRQAIIEAIGSAVYDYDEYRLTQWLEKFTEDATYTVQIRGVTMTIVKGRDAISAALAPRQAQFQQQGIQRRHTMSNIIVDALTPTHATARSYVILAATGPHGPIEIMNSGRYSWGLVKREGHWLVDAVTGNADNPQVATS